LQTIEGKANGERRFLRLPAVCTKVGLSRSRLYELIAAGRFPPQIRLSDRASAWDSREVDRWMDSRIAESRESA
jgi:prophage regulatory protein